MILSNEERQTEFELRVLGYQFPEVESCEYDANWLMIQVNVRTLSGSWSATDPCMLTWETHWLLNWLADLESNRENSPEISFLESNLMFRVEGKSEQAFDLRICVSGELGPRYDISEDMTPIEIPLHISVSDLRQCVLSLSRELGLFPVRAGRKRRCRPYSDPENDCLLCGCSE